MNHRVLVADDHAPSLQVVNECLESEGFEVELARDGSEAWAALERPGAPQIAILDWRMPGMDGVDVCRRLREKNDEHYTYIVLLSALRDREQISRGLSAGADDYIVKPFDANELIERVRAGCRVVEREHALREGLKAEHESQSKQLAALSTTDELTGLCNRRAFMNLAEQHARLALRRREPFSVLFMDLNGLKLINDHLGHEAGDRAIREAAGLLKRTVRDADILARLGGDEFVALLDGGAETVQVVLSRLGRELEALDSQLERAYRVSISAGAAFFDPAQPQSIEDLLAHADQQMYAQKRQRRTRSGPIVLGLSAATELRSSVPPSKRPLPSLRPSLLSLPSSRASDVLEHLLSAWSARRPDGFAHAQRLMTYAQHFAHALGITGDAAESLVQATALHDIGELALPDSVLDSSPAPTAERRASRRRHTSFGMELLSGMSSSLCRHAASVALHHHERWDGEGYPNGLRGIACPRDARVVGILDAYDRLRNDVLPGGAKPSDARLAEYFRAERERRFDPELIDCMLEVLGELGSLDPLPALH